MAATANRNGAAWLKEYLRASFYLGKISAGDKLPSHRELAKQLGISPTTALELYQALESEGILDAKERSGTFLKQIGIEADRQPRDAALLRLVSTTITRLALLSVSPDEYIRLLLRYLGNDVRQDFQFGLLMHPEAFEIAASTAGRKCQARLPMVQLSPDPEDRRRTRTLLARDTNIRCLVATYLHIDLATSLAREFDRHVLMARPERTAESIFEVPKGDCRYVVTRDQNTAEDLKRLISLIFPPSNAACFVIASLHEEDILCRIADEAVEILVSPSAHAEARRRFGPLKRLQPIPSNLSDDTVDEMVFNYLFA